MHRERCIGRMMELSSASNLGASAPPLLRSSGRWREPSKALGSGLWAFRRLRPAVHLKPVIGLRSAWWSLKMLLVRSSQLHLCPHDIVFIHHCCFAAAACAMPLLQDKRDAWSIEYDFEYGGVSTVGMPRHGAVTPYVPSGARASRDTLPGDYSRKVME